MEESLGQEIKEEEAKATAEANVIVDQETKDAIKAEEEEAAADISLDRLVKTLLLILFTAGELVL